jgi:hypothetical protein
MQSIDVLLVRNICDLQYEGNFATLPSDGTGGGIIIVANDSAMQILNSIVTTHTISITIKYLRKTQLVCLLVCMGHKGALRKKCSSESLRY